MEAAGLGPSLIQGQQHPCCWTQTTPTPSASLENQELLALSLGEPLPGEDRASGHSSQQVHLVHSGDPWAPLPLMPLPAHLMKSHLFAEDS
jgi:hypothetical protein